jgi:hypothetical protein
LDFFGVVFEVLILDVFALEALILEVLVVHTREDVGNELSIPTTIAVTMILTPMHMFFPIVPIILAFMLPIRRPMRVIRPKIIIAAGLVVLVIFLVLLTIVLPAAPVLGRAPA